MNKVQLKLEIYECQKQMMNSFKNATKKVFSIDWTFDQLINFNINVAAIFSAKIIITMLITFGKNINEKNILKKLFHSLIECINTNIEI